MLEVGLPSFLWAELAKTSMYLLNRSPTKAHSGHIPEETFSRKIVNLLHLRAIGCLTLVHIPDRYMKKLQQIAEKGDLVGYDDSTKGYCVYMPHKHTVTVTRDVAFDESRIYKGDSIAPQFDVEKLLELRPNYLIPEYHEGGDCRMTPRASKPSKTHNSVVENYERVNTSPALSAPTLHNTIGTEIQEAAFPIQSGPSSTFKDKSFSTPNSTKFLDLSFSTEVAAPSFHFKKFGMPNHDSQGKLPHNSDPYSFEDFSPPHISTPLATT